MLIKTSKQVHSYIKSSLVDVLIRLMSSRLLELSSEYYKMSLLVILLWKQFQNCFIFYADTIVSSSCCASLDYIVTYLFKHIAKEGKKTLRCREISQDGQRLFNFMQQNPEVLQQVNCQSSLWDIINFINFSDLWILWY